MRAAALLFLLLFSTVLRGEDTVAPRTVYIPIDGPIDDHRHDQFERALDQALAAKAERIVVHLTTDGGHLDAAMKMLNRVLVLPDGKPELIAYIDNRAYSAGALIAYGHDKIYLASSASIGDIGVIFMSQDPKEPIKYAPEKIESPVRALLRQTAQHNGWDQAKLQKMTARNQELWRFDVPDGKGGTAKRFVIDDDLPQFLADNKQVKKEDAILVLGEDRLITYTAQEAVAEGMATGLAKDLDDLYRQLGTTAGQVQRLEPSSRERIAETLGGFAPFLLALTVLFVILEFKLGGFGLFISLAGVCLTLFLICQFYYDLAGYPELILIGLGLILVALDLFWLPTGGWLAGGGLLLAAFGAVFAFMPDAGQWNFSAEGWGAALAAAFRQAVIALLVMAVGAFLLLAAMPAIVARRGMSSVAEIDQVSGETAGGRADLVGRTGVARTALRPGGFITVGSDDVAATAENGAQIEPGTQVTIVAVRFGEAIVRVVA